MVFAQSAEPSPRKPLRLWPGVSAGALIALAWFIVPYFMPETILYGMLATAVGAVVVLVWWLGFSRARWFERLGALLLIAGIFLATKRLIHISLTNGAMGMLFPVLAIPVLSLALVVWAVATRRLSDSWRRVSLVGTVVIAFGAFTLLRTGGFTGYADSDWHWRWSKTPEERLLAQASDEPVAPATASAAVSTSSGTDWPGFRGPGRDGVVNGTQIKTDWKAAPPAELWRRPIGPGWSSFAVHGDLIYTQEQRG